MPSRFSGGSSSSGRMFSKRDLISAVVRVLAKGQHHRELDVCGDLRVVGHVIDTVHVGFYKLSVGRVVRVDAMFTKDTRCQILWLII